jgi:hypothetical protein
MRWSERRTAVRSTFEMTPHVHSDRRAALSAVAHLVLVRRMALRLEGTDKWALIIALFLVLGGIIGFGVQDGFVIPHAAWGDQPGAARPKTEREYVTKRKRASTASHRSLLEYHLADMFCGPHEALMQHATSNQTLQPAPSRRLKG